jgi:hypothetical protein
MRFLGEHTKRRKTKRRISERRQLQNVDTTKRRHYKTSTLQNVES